MPANMIECEARVSLTCGMPLVNNDFFVGYKGVKLFTTLLLLRKQTTSQYSVVGCCVSACARQCAASSLQEANRQEQPCSSTS
jgi:hypothetical protein